MLSNPVLDGAPRNQRRTILGAERFKRASGTWGKWDRLDLPKGSVGQGGWASEIMVAYRNDVFSVLVRDAGYGVTHYAVGSLSGIRPSWWEMQRIKNELAGNAATAVEVYPPQDEVVDEANMFHFWVLPGPLTFGLKP